MRYISSEITLRELAQEENVPYQTLCNRSAEGRWSKLRREVKGEGNDTLDRVIKKLIEKMEGAIDEGRIDGKEIKALAGALKELREMQKDAGEPDAGERQLEVMFVGEAEELSR